MNELEQVRLLSDPLKIKIIQALAETGHTAKEVADALGDNVTRLYRHIDALLDAGLVEVVRETPKRGTVERTFRAVAKRFEVDHRLFGRDDDSRNAVRDLLRAGEQELIDALEHCEEDEPVFMRLKLRGSPEEIRRLRRALLDWVDDAQESGDGCGDHDTEEAGAIIAFYPVRN